MKNKNKSQIETMVKDAEIIINSLQNSDVEIYHQTELKKLNDDYIKKYNRIEQDYKNIFKIISNPNDYIPTRRDEYL